MVDPLTGRMLLASIVGTCPVQGVHLDSSPGFEVFMEILVLVDRRHSCQQVLGKVLLMVPPDQVFRPKGPRTQIAPKYHQHYSI